MDDIPMKGALCRQVNVRISETTFQDLEHLRSLGVDIGELLRPEILKKIEHAKKAMAQAS